MTFGYDPLPEYKAKRFGTQLLVADRWFPSSKLCSDCGWKNTELQLSDRQWACQECGVIHDRDINAAKNLENLLCYPEATGKVYASPDMSAVGGSGQETNHPVNA